MKIVLKIVTKVMGGRDGNSRVKVAEIPRDAGQERAGNGIPKMAGAGGELEKIA